MRVGDVIRIGKFDAVGDGVTMYYKAPSRTEGYVFMFMGVEPRDGSKGIDLMAVMDRLGWQPKKDTE